MKKLKYIGGGLKTIVGVGEFFSGDEKEVDDSVAMQYEGLDGWEISGSRKTKSKDVPPPDEPII